MVEVTSPARDTYLVHAQRPSWGKNEASGVAVYFYRRSGAWDCERCDSAHGTTRNDCIHILCVRELLDAEDEGQLA
jgi:hypothetical protein